MKKQKQVLYLVLRTSKSLGVLLGCACLAAIFAAYFLPIDKLSYALLILLMLIYLDVMIFKHVIRRSDDAIVAVLRDFAGRWTLLHKDQTELPMLYLDNHFISNVLIVLHFKSATGRRDLALTKDMLHPRDWHQLKMLLLYD